MACHHSSSSQVSVCAQRYCTQGCRSRSPPPVLSALLLRTTFDLSTSQTRSPPSAHPWSVLIMLSSPAPTPVTVEGVGRMWGPESRGWGVSERGTNRQTGDVPVLFFFFSVPSTPFLGGVRIAVSPSHSIPRLPPRPTQIPGGFARRVQLLQR